MAENRIPQNAGLKISLGTKMLNGLEELGSSLGITQITASDFQTMLDGFIGAEQAFNACRNAKQTASTSWRSSADALKSWLLVTRTVLAGRFGRRWSAAWADAGFVNHSTAIPSNNDKRLSLALSLVNLFLAHPSYEVANLQVTAARGTTLRNAALAADAALTQAKVNAGDEKSGRGTASAGLTKMMRSLIKILGATLERDDMRWLTFGLNMPAADTTPGVPQNVSAVLDETGAIVLGCDAVEYGVRYRWRMQLVGAESGYVLVRSASGTSAVVKSVLPGQTAQFIVQAANGEGQQGVASAPVMITVPAAVVAHAAEAAPVKTHGNGNGNGNGNGRGYGHAVKTRVG